MNILRLSSTRHPDQALTTAIDFHPQSNVNALIDMKLEKNKNLVEESLINWGEIVCGTLKFDRMESEVSICMKAVVAFVSLIHFLERYLSL